MHFSSLLSFFFFNATPTTEIYTLSLHDALPIFPRRGYRFVASVREDGAATASDPAASPASGPAQTASQVDVKRSEEHTSELQSHSDLVCRLLLEKKKKKKKIK